jgi:hypothetical protein
MLDEDLMNENKAICGSETRVRVQAQAELAQRVAELLRRASTRMSLEDLKRRMTPSSSLRERRDAMRTRHFQIREGRGNVKNIAFAGKKKWTMDMQLSSIA